MLATVVALTFSFGACNKGPSNEQCEQYLDHSVDLEINAAGAKNLTPEMKADLAKQKKTISDAARTAFMDMCSKKAPKKLIECGIAAKTLDELAKCDDTK